MMGNTAAVLGHPITHSLSPLIHNYVYKKLAINAEYIAVDVQDAEFVDWITKAITGSSQWLGFSLTMPLKELVCKDELSEIIAVDELSRRIRSANTLYLEDGVWRATSTDVIGIHNLLKPYSFSKVAILGAGGTARAALAVMEELSGVNSLKVTVYRRSTYRDVALRSAAPSLNLDIQDWNLVTYDKNYDLVINTVPNEAIVSNSEKIVGGSIFFDALYHPWRPALTQRQIQKGGTLITGLNFLAAQAIPQIHLMTGKSFDDLVLYEELVQRLEASI